MHGPMNVKSPNNTSKWQMGFNSAFKGLKHLVANTAYCMFLTLQLLSVCKVKVKFTLELATKAQK
jgi:hypothetical protein